MNMLVFPKPRAGVPAEAVHQHAAAESRAVWDLTRSVPWPCPMPHRSERFAPIAHVGGRDAQRVQFIGDALTRPVLLDGATIDQAYHVRLTEHASRQEHLRDDKPNGTSPRA